MGVDVTLYMMIDVGRDDQYRVELYSGGTTHNLVAMADAAGIYKAIWRPHENNMKIARDLIKPLSKGFKKMYDNPDKFKKHNAPNGWGTYADFTRFVEEYLEACRTFPKALVESDV